MKTDTSIIVAVLIVALFAGCGFVTVNIVQRATQDVGDGTEDSYSVREEQKETDTAKLVVPIK